MSVYSVGLGLERKLGATGITRTAPPAVTTSMITRDAREPQKHNKVDPLWPRATPSHYRDNGQRNWPASLTRRMPGALEFAKMTLGATNT